VLARVLKAYVRSGSSNTNSGNSGNASTESVLTFLQGVSDEVSSAVAGEAAGNPSEVLFSMTAIMCIDIAKTVSVSQPGLFKTMCESMMRLLQVAGSFSLRAGPSTSPALLATVSTLQEYAQLMASQGQGETRAAALGLLLAVAINTGSLKSLLAVADLLAAGSESLPSSADVFFKKLQEAEVELDIDMLTNTTSVDNFSPSSPFTVSNTHYHISSPPS